MMYSSGDNLRILDAANKAEDTSYYNAADASKTVEKLTFDGVHRYDTLADFAGAVQTADVSTFTQSGLWHVDETNGLVWGKAV